MPVMGIWDLQTLPPRILYILPRYKLYRLPVHLTVVLHIHQYLGLNTYSNRRLPSLPTTSNT